MNKYRLMRINMTTNFILFDLYNDVTHTNFELKLCVSIKRCIDSNMLRGMINEYIGKNDNLENWLKILEIINHLYYIER